ncbi:MAG: hypothetical protein LC775_16375, partial [Acidobacteria bacterium]|nr:hypothetical protein [Acidobacteriota bacterium]
AEPLDYVRPVRRLALRWQLKNGQTRYGALLSTLEPREVISLVGQPVDRVNDPHAVLLAYAKFYDQRGGGVETEFKQSVRHEARKWNGYKPQSPCRWAVSLWSVASAAG